MRSRILFNKGFLRVLADREIFGHSEVSTEVGGEYGWDVARDGMPEIEEEEHDEDEGGDHTDDDDVDAKSSNSACVSVQEYVTVQTRK